MQQRMIQPEQAGRTVVLYRNAAAVAAGTARDINLLGMFVELCAGALSRHRVVEVEFFDADGRPLPRLPAMVMREENAGAGLIFETSDTTTRAVIRTLTRPRRGKKGPMSGRGGAANREH